MNKKFVYQVGNNKKVIHTPFCSRDLILKCHNISIITNLQKIIVILHSSMNTEDSSLWAYYVVTTGKYLLIFRVIIVPLSLVSGRCDCLSQIA